MKGRYTRSTVYGNVLSVEILIEYDDKNGQGA